MCFGAGLLCTRKRHFLVFRALITADSSHRLIRRHLVGTLTADTRPDGRVVRCTGKDEKRGFVVLVGSLVVGAVG